MSIIKERARSIVHHVLGGSPSGVNAAGKKLEKISKYLTFEARTLRTEAFYRIAHEPAGTTWLEHRKSNVEELDACLLAGKTSMLSWTSRSR
jgi:hypothetical protein